MCRASSNGEMFSSESAHGKCILHISFTTCGSGGTSPSRSTHTCTHVRSCDITYMHTYLLFMHARIKPFDYPFAYIFFCSDASVYIYVWTCLSGRVYVRSTKLRMIYEHSSPPDIFRSAIRHLRYGSWHASIGSGGILSPECEKVL